MKKTLRQKQAEATRDKLLDVALQLFSQQGFKESTVKDIGRAAGVTDGLIYHYFKSKEELFWEVMEKYTINRPLQDLLEGVDEQETFEDQLINYFKLMFEYLRIRQDFIVMCFSEAQRNEKIHEKLLVIIKQGCSQLQEFILSRSHIKVEFITIQNLIHSFFLYFLIRGRFIKDETIVNHYIEHTIKDFLNIIGGKK